MAHLSFSSLRGRTSELIASFNWKDTSLGAIDQWPASLQVTVNNMLHSRFPTLLVWGSEFIQLFNDAFLEMLCPQDDLVYMIGKPAREYWIETWPMIEPIIKRVTGSGDNVWKEDVPISLTRNGQRELAYWTFSCSPVFNEGRPTGMLVTCLETTAKVKGQLKAEHSQQEILALFEESPVGIANIGADEGLTFLTANDFYGELVGRSITDIVGKPLLQALPEIGDQGFDKILREVIHTAKPFIASEVAVDILRHGAIEKIYVDLAFQPRKNAEGLVHGVLIVATDVTQQVRARKSLEQQQRLYEAVTNSTPDLIYIFTLDYRFSFANKALLTMWGRSAEESLGKGLLDVGYESWHAEMHEREIDQVVATKQPVRGEVSFPHAIMGKRVYDYLFVPILNESGEVEAVAGTTRDITEIKRAQESLRENEAVLQQKVAERTEQLERTVAELRRSNGNLEEFAYAASHDLKEPIRKIHFFGDRLEQSLTEHATGSQLHDISRLKASAARMSALIDDILAYSQLSFVPEMTSGVDLTMLVQQVAAELDLQIEQTGASIRIGELGAIDGYPRQLQQVFHNLILNSIKYRDPHRPSIIEIASRQIKGYETGLPLAPAESDKLFYEIAVHDNGIGFDSEDTERIFQVFTRLQNSSTLKGTGVGLSIVRKVMENHNGYVRAYGKKDEGAVFYLYFPL